MPSTRRTTRWLTPLRDERTHQYRHPEDEQDHQHRLVEPLRPVTSEDPLAQEDPEHGQRHEVPVASSKTASVYSMFSHAWSSMVVIAALTLGPCGR